MSDHNPGSELDLDGIEAQARHWDHLIRDDPETTLALVAEVRRLRAQVERVEALFAGGPDTPCRARWYEVNPGNDHFCTSVEFVEVPMADLREALRQ